MKKIKKFLYNWIEDISIFIGIFFIVFTTFKINFYGGMYVLGVIFLLLGIYWCYYPPGIDK